MPDPPPEFTFAKPVLAPLATSQLAAWQDIADDWPLHVDGWHERCTECGQSVLRLFDHHAVPYRYTPAQRRMLIVAHLRQAHTEMDPDRE
jgi:hypothetical protein